MLIVPDLPGSGESGDAGAAGHRRAHGGEPRCRDCRPLSAPDGRFSLAGFSLGGLIAGYLAQLAGAPRRHVWCWSAAPAWGVARRPMRAAEILAVARHRRGEARDPSPEPRHPDDPRHAKIDDLAVVYAGAERGALRVRGKHIVKTSALAQLPARRQGAARRHLGRARRDVAVRSGRRPAAAIPAAGDGRDRSRRRTLGSVRSRRHGQPTPTRAAWRARGGAPAPGAFTRGPSYAICMICCASIASPMPATTPPSTRTMAACPVVRAARMRVPYMAASAIAAWIAARPTK